MAILPPSPFIPSVAIVERPAEAPAVVSVVAPSDAAAACSDICDIGEIFRGARKLFDPDPAAYPREDEVYYEILKAMDNPHERDLPYVPQGLIDAIEPLPLFLRQAV